MEVALMIEGQEGADWDDWLALGRACEASGWQGLFRSDHYSTGDPGRDPGGLEAWPVPAGLAMATSAIRLGTLVSPVTFRHPAVLAKSAATVDHIFGWAGRTGDRGGLNGS